MLVEIMTAALITTYALFGVDAGCCDSCGNIWDQEFMTTTYYADCMYYGDLCPECTDYWNI